MGVVINQTKCIGCGSCIRICPGNVIRKGSDNKAYLSDSSDCWNCTSCMKECLVQAIYLSLAPAIGGSGSRMTLTRKGHVTEWEINKKDSRITIVTDTDEANKY